MVQIARRVDVGVLIEKDKNTRCNRVIPGPLRQKLAIFFQFYEFLFLYANEAFLDCRT